MPRRVAAFIAHRNLPLPTAWWLEVWSGLTAICWSILSAIYDGNVAQQEMYRQVIRILPHAGWEELGILLGGMQVIACVIHNRVCRIITAGLMSAFWCLLAYLIFHSEVESLGVIFYKSWGIANGVSLLLLLSRPNAR